MCGKSNSFAFGDSNASVIFGVWYNTDHYHPIAQIS